MSESLLFDEREDLDKLVIRTHFSDEDAWWQVVSAMDEPWGGGEFESSSYVVNDRRWDGAGVEEISLAARQDPGLGVVFLADDETMSSTEHTLLAVNLDETRNHLDESYDPERGTAFGRRFRILPNEASAMQVNLALGNMDYEDWANAAALSSDGVFRGF